jgi:hypothetical protein
MLVRDSMSLNGLLKKGLAISVDDMAGWIVSAKQKMLSSQDPLDGVCPPEQLELFVRSYETYELAA